MLTLRDTFFRLRAILGIVLISVPCLSMASNSLPELGDPSLQEFSQSTEKKYGELFMQTLRANAEFVDDALLQHYLTSLGQKLLTHSDAADNDFKFFIIRSDAINAFAGPDAHIGINSGLFQRAKNESELASVLAHEIAHVSQRHLARMFSRQDSSTALTIGAIIAAILVGAQSPDAAQALLATGVASSYQTSINFTRENEYEADRIGIGILDKAGIDTRGMVGFFKTLLEDSHGLQIEYLRTHPLNVNRVSEAEHRIADNHAFGNSDSADFRFAQARLLALTVSDPASLLLPIDQLTESHLIYRQALAHIQLGNMKKAVGLLKMLQKSERHPWVKLALVDAYQGAGNNARAISLAGDIVELLPGYLPATLTYASMRLQQGGKMKPVITLLKHQLQTDNKASLHKMLAKAYYLDGQVAAALESTGNQYLIQGYKELALQQFENARNQQTISHTTEQRLEKKIELLSPQLH